MSCTNPNLMRFFVDSSTGEVLYSFAGSGRFKDPSQYGTPYIDKEWFIPVPCGKCLSCRCDYSRDWANRMILELQDHDESLFLTLTYNDEHLPFSDKGFPTLLLRDVQLFLKRLRKHFSDRRIRYYLAGEYGSETHRPHYHAIIYGIGLSSFDDLVYRGTNKLGHPYFTSPTLESIWDNGFVSFSSVTWRTCNYVARYVLKKQIEIDECDGVCLSPFNVSSRRPGIGLSRADELLSSGHSVFPIDGKDGIHDVPIPRSLLKRLKEINLEKYDELCYNRCMVALERIKLEASSTSMYYSDYLESKNDALFRKLHSLPERR